MWDGVGPGTKSKRPRPRLASKHLYLCQKKKQLREHVAMPARANLHRLRPANSCARKWNTFARENMVRARLNRRSPSACQRRAVPEYDCPHPRRERRLERLAGRPNTILPKVRDAADRQRNAPGPLAEGWKKSPDRQLPIARCRARHMPRRVNAPRRAGQPQPEEPPAPEVRVAVRSVWSGFGRLPAVR